MPTSTEEHANAAVAATSRPMTTPLSLTDNRPDDAEPPDPGRLLERGRALTATDFAGECATIAESLLGTLLCHETPAGPVGGIVVETEAYLGVDDPSCHLAAGVTERTRPFLDGAGTLYVYSIFGHDCLDVITTYGSYPECVLIRALQPVFGVDRMEARRGRTEPTELTSGPGKLTEALGVTTAEHDHTALEDSPIAFYDVGLDNVEVAVGRRVGISDAEDWPLRFCVAGSPFLSRPLEPASADAFDVAAFYRDLDSSRRPEAPDR